MNDSNVPGTTIPKPIVMLTGVNGNAYSILGYVKKALRRASCDAAVIEQFVDEATAGDYDHLLRTCFKWVHVE